MAINVSKTGQGAFGVRQEDDGRVFVRIGVNGTEREFPNAQAAYDAYRPAVEGNHAFWNACYALEDLIGGDA
jgi:hypothetical protein